MKRTIPCLIVMTILVADVSARVPDKPVSPVKLPKEIQLAWEMAGANLVWGPRDLSPNLLPQSMANLVGGPLHEQPAGDGYDLPVFEFEDRSPTAEILAALPQPPGDFGICLHKANDEIVRSLARFKRLRLLRAHSDITNEGLKQICNVGSIRCLDLLATKINDEGLADLANLPELESLSLRQTKVTADGLKHLKHCKRLRALDVTLLMLADPAMRSLAEISSLELLVMRSNAKITNAGLQEIGSLKNLRYLDLDQTGITDAGMKYLTGLAHLRCLNVRGTKVSGDGLKDLHSLKNLQWLTVGSSANRYDVNLDGIGHLKELRHLSLHGSVTETALRQVATMPKLTKLIIPNSNLASISLRSIGPLKGLEVLFIAGNGNLTDNSFRYLTPFENLHELNVSHTRLTDEGLKDIAKLKTLRSLSLELTKITDISELAALTNLESLDLTSTSVKDGYKSLSKLKKLRVLNASSVTVNGKWLIEIAQLPELRVLDISHSGIADEDLPRLATLRNLQKLTMGDVFLSEQAVSKLRTAMPETRILWSPPRSTDQ